MLVRMNARQIATPYLPARAGLVAVASVVLASVALALVLARRDGLGARAVVVLVPVGGAALGSNERRDGQHHDGGGDTNPILHGDSPFEYGASASLRADSQLLVGLVKRESILVGAPRAEGAEDVDEVRDSARPLESGDWKLDPPDALDAERDQHEIQWVEFQVAL
jgi:hypothetical protein